MIKHEIIEKISKYFKLTEFEAEQVYDDIFSIIMNGVKEDNIIDVTNFGEFIIKYNNGKSNGNGNGNGIGSEYRKTVEFLSSSSLEEELNQSIIGEEPGTYKSGEITQTPSVVEEQTSERSSIEEELRRKREEILSKITGPILTIPPILSLGQKEEKPAETPEPEKIEEQAPVGNITESPVAPVIEEHEEIKDSDIKTVEKEAEEQVDELSHKSFSDYFSEVSSETKPVTEPEPLKEPEKEVIPKSAVLLHNEIVGTSEPPKTPLKEEPVKTTIQPLSETTVQPEHRAEDNSYYIWYKDSESNPTDTQALSYEYELLYQATKEAEYKSKLGIFVTTFILFFSIVLLLLIFSPLIYKFFFSPEEFKQNIEKTQEQPPDVSEQKGTPNVIPENNIQSEQNQVQPPSDTNSQKQEVQNLQTEQQSTQQNQTQLNSQQQNQDPKPPVEEKIEGIVKNSIGWMDEKNKVIYIQLENGKYTIQESSWDSESKASKHVSAIESLGISGLKGNIIRADLGEKGTWFRTRFGEFSSLEEARKKAEELKSK
jgi:nucleoid DNA-binding protein